MEAVFLFEIHVGLVHVVSLSDVHGAFEIEANEMKIVVN